MSSLKQYEKETKAFFNKKATDILKDAKKFKQSGKNFFDEKPLKVGKL